MPTCAEAIAAALKKIGIKRVFGVPGGEIADLIEALRKSGLEFILTRHEGVAAFMADVTGQITGLPGVCLATLGPGATNLINGIANAYLDRSPVLAITAQVATANQPYLNHQLIDLERLFEPVSKRVYRFTGEGSEEIVLAGYRLATTGPKGPVYLCLPSDVAQKEERPGRPGRNDLVPETAAEPNVQETISRIGEAIRKSRRPLVVLGLGLDQAKDISAAARFIKKNRLPVLTTPKAKGAFSAAEPLFLGTTYGMMDEGIIADVFMQSDLVIGIGFDPVESDKMWHREVNIISICGYSIRHRRFTPAAEAIGDIKSILERLMETDFSGHDWADRDLGRLKSKLRSEPTPAGLPKAGMFSPTDIIRVTRKTLPGDAILTTDVGAHKLLVSKTWNSYEPLTFFTSNGFSSMGYGLPAAMAAKLTLPEARVVCLTGDGGLAMVLQDLETAVRLGLPLAILVLCDNCLSLIEMVQKRRGFARSGVDFGNMDFVAIARGFGARGVRLASLDELPRVLDDAADEVRPTVVEIPVDNSLYRLPF
ncbi:MAG: thiamine pyrophosphate-binding protein [Thermodesulfobacteriota bacterium]